MLPNSRFVLIDDKQTHLDVLKNAFHQLHTDCQAVIYDPHIGIGDRCFPGMRVLFIDLHLTSDGTSTDTKQHFGTILQILDQCTQPDTGPYVLVLWTSHADEVGGLKDYIDAQKPKSFAPEKRPVAITSLNKNEHFSTISKTPEIYDTEKFKAEVLAAIGDNPQIKSLLEWELDVQIAASATLASLVSLVPLDKRSDADFGPELGKILYQISRAGAGADRAMESPRESINQVLLPVLADRISKHDPEGDSSVDWTPALVKDNGKPTPELQAGINAALHLALPVEAAEIAKQNTELGTVIIPTQNAENVFVKLVGKTRSEILESEFGMAKATHRELCRLCLVRIGAACDNAQPKPGNNTFLLCMDTEIQAGGHFSPNKKVKDDEWHSPLVTIPGQNAPGRLVVKLRYAVSLPEATVANWNARYRLRESLVNTLTQNYARFISRPGIIDVRG